jgi:hypothetical protein
MCMVCSLMASIIIHLAIGRKIDYQTLYYCIVAVLILLIVVGIGYYGHTRIDSKYRGTRHRRIYQWMCIYILKRFLDKDNDDAESS